MDSLRKGVFLYKPSKTIGSLVERKSLYQFHFTVSTVLIGSIFLFLIILLTPNSEVVIIKRRDISVGLQDIYANPQKPSGRSSGNDLTLPEMKGIAPGYRMVADAEVKVKEFNHIYISGEAPIITDNFGTTDGRDHGLWWGNNEGVGPPGYIPEWPLEEPIKFDTRTPEINININKEPRVGRSKPIQIIFANGRFISPPLKTRYIIERAVFHIELIVKANGTIPQDGIIILFYEPSDLPENYLKIYRENISNLFRTEAFINPALRNGEKITDTTRLRLVYEKGEGGLSAESTRDVDIIW